MFVKRYLYITLYNNVFIKNISPNRIWGCSSAGSSACMACKRSSVQSRPAPQISLGGTTVVELIAIVKSEKGIHARPSRDIALKAKEYRSHIVIQKEGTKIEANAKEVISLLSNCFDEGDRLLIRANGPDEHNAAEAIVHLVETLQY
jgi:phosphocarrier protein HPr